MRLLSSFNRGIKYLCLIDFFTKYAQIKLLTDEKAKAVLHGFIERVNESKCKPNKLYWLTKEEKFTID